MITTLRISFMLKTSGEKEVTDFAGVFAKVSNRCLQVFREQSYLNAYRTYLDVKAGEKDPKLPLFVEFHRIHGERRDWKDYVVITKKKRP